MSIYNFIAVHDYDTLQSQELWPTSINALGEQSAISQMLTAPITSTELFKQHSISPQQQKLYIAVSTDDTIVGYIKTGYKHLFYVNGIGEYQEIDPLCILDFYIVKELQRLGVGRQLFLYVLQKEELKAADIAYDRPSPKLFQFLAKYENLKDFVPQPNRFVIFNEYFKL